MTKNDTKSLAGKWRAVREGSDFVPGIDRMTGCPMVVARLSTMTSCLTTPFHNNDADTPVLVIQKNDVNGTEEISLQVQPIRAAGTETDIIDERHYQLGTANFESMSSSAVTLGIVQNCDVSFREFCVYRIGPKSGQSSREIYKLDKATGYLSLEVAMLTSIGITVPIVRLFKRVDEPTSRKAELPIQDSDPQRESTYSHKSFGSFSNISPSTAATIGWGIYDFWPSNVLTAAKVTMVKAVKIYTPRMHSQHSQAKQQEQVLWSNKGLEGGDDDSATLEKSLVSTARRHGNRVSDGEEIIEFVMMVTLGESHTRKRSWYTSHRFKEFDALRQFIINQDPCNKAFLDQSSKFPSKVVIGIAHRQSALQSRVQGLEQFMVYFLENARYMRQNSVDAMCSFLQIPEHLAEVALLADTRASSQPTPLSQTPKPNSRRSIFASATTPSPTVTTATAVTTTSAADTPLQPRTSPPKKPLNTAATTTNITNTTNTVSVSGKFADKGATTNDSTTTGTASVSATASTATSTLVLKDSLGSAQVPPSGARSFSINASYGNGGMSSRATLLSRLREEGILVVKHGRSGAPKKRVLKCDPGMTILYWQSPTDAAKEEKHRRKSLNRGDGLGLGGEIKFEQKDDKFVRIEDIQSIRMGTEIDPTAPMADEAREAMDAIEDVDSAQNSQPVQKSPPTRRKSVIFKVRKAGADDVQFGTATLRRRCTQEDELSLCFSLILTERTFDVQCLNKEDFDFLFYNLKELHEGEGS